LSRGLLRADGFRWIRKLALLEFPIVVVGVVIEEMVVDRPPASRNIVPTVLYIQSAEFELSTVYILFEMKETRRKSEKVKSSHPTRSVEV
jgi:hypothetical protein